MDEYKIMQKPVQWRLRPGERRLILLFGDLIVGILALSIAIFLWAQGDQWLKFSLTFLQERVDSWFYLLPLIWILLLTEIYDIHRASRWRETLRGVVIAAAISLGVYVLVFFFAPPNSLPRRGVAVFIIVAFIFTLLWRSMYIRIFTAPLFTRRTLIVGAGRAGSALASIVRKVWPSPFFLVGLIDDDEEKIGTQIEGYPVLGGSEQLLNIVRDEHISDVIISISGQMAPELFQALSLLEEQGIEVTTMPVIYEELLGRVPIFLLNPDWLLRSFFDEAHTSGVFEITKRLMDIIGGLFGTLILLLITPFVTLAILLDTGAPVIYTQVRLGMRGRPYKIIKFRTMITDAEKDGVARPASENDDRITRVGRFLRKSHLDEFPQFINVLRGDMSLVGPRAERPEIITELQERIPFYRGRLLVRPGVTGWAQVNFGYASNVESNGIKLEYDLYYIKHRSLALDFTIIFRTVGDVFGFRGQ